MTKRVVIIEGAGHPLVRATHSKTLEVTTERTVSERATCVVAVAATTKGRPDLLRGPVSLRLEVDDQVASGSGIVNPVHRVSDRLVVRRSSAGGPETLIQRSTLTAADLAPTMVERLQRSDARVRLIITEEDESPKGANRGALVLLDQGRGWSNAGRIESLWAAADVEIDLRYPLATEALQALRGAGTVAAVGVNEADSEPVRRRALDRLRALVSSTGGVRVAVSSDDPSLELLLAAGLSPEPVQRLGLVRKARDLARTAVPGPFATVIRLARDDAAAVLAPLARTHPEHPVAVCDARSDVGTAALWTIAAGVGPLVSDQPDETTLVVVPADESVLLGELRSVARELIEAGVRPRTVSEALAPFGLGRRSLYSPVTISGEAEPAAPGMARP